MAPFLREDHVDMSGRAIGRRFPVCVLDCVSRGLSDDDILAAGAPDKLAMFWRQLREHVDVEDVLPVSPDSVGLTPHMPFPLEPCAPHVGLVT